MTYAHKSSKVPVRTVVIVSTVIKAEDAHKEGLTLEEPQLLFNLNLKVGRELRLQSSIVGMIAIWSVQLVLLNVCH